MKKVNVISKEFSSREVHVNSRAWIRCKESPRIRFAAIGAAWWPWSLWSLYGLAVFFFLLILFLTVGCFDHALQQLNAVITMHAHLRKKEKKRESRRSEMKSKAEWQTIIPTNQNCPLHYHHSL